MVLSVSAKEKPSDVSVVAFIGFTKFKIKE
jgi:hypothetical protein